MKAKRIKGADPAGPLAENAAKIVKVRLAELCALATPAADPAAAQAQHDMRIAAKRLRYVLEATGFCLGKRGGAARKCAKELQELLGEIHDVDVMLPRLAEHRALMRGEDAEAVRASAGETDDLEPALAARAPHRTAYRGLEVLEVYLLARRRVLYDRFREAWGRQRERGVWRSLERAADEQLEIARRRREAESQAACASAALEDAERVRREAAERAERAAAALAEVERPG